MTIVADADGVMGLGLPYGRYPDRPRSQPALAAEHNLNPECAEEGLCPAQPASQCARALWPASPAGADALPVHLISRTQAATGSASTIFSIAARRLLE
jgi:hypothetical protein